MKKIIIAAILLTMVCCKSDDKIVSESEMIDYSYDSYLTESNLDYLPRLLGTSKIQFSNLFEMVNFSFSLTKKHKVIIEPISDMILNISGISPIFNSTNSVWIEVLVKNDGAVSEVNVKDVSPDFRYSNSLDSLKKTLLDSKWRPGLKSKHSVNSRINYKVQILELG